MSRVGVVARREFLATVRRKSFLIWTLAMPIFVALYGLVVGLPAIQSKKKAAQGASVGVVNFARALVLSDSLVAVAPADSTALTGVMPQAAPGSLKVGAMHFHWYPDTTAARVAFNGGEITAFYVVPDTFMTTGTVFRYGRKESVARDDDAERGALDRLLRRGVLTQHVDPVVLERAVSPIAPKKLRIVELQEDGRFAELAKGDRVTAFIVPLLFGVLLVISMMGSGTTLLLGVAEEKENRVMEILLSSLKPQELFAGKMVGLGAAALLQLGIWIGGGLLFSAQGLPLLISNASSAQVPVHVWLGCLLFFLGGYFQYGSLMLGFGSLGNSARESQQITWLWTMLTMLPFILLGTFLEDPNGTLARTLSFVPITAPLAMMLRMSGGGLAWWEMPVSLLVVLGGAAIALLLSAKMFRVGILLYGKRVTLPEILRWIRT